MYESYCLFFKQTFQDSSYLTQVTDTTTLSTTHHCTFRSTKKHLSFEMITQTSSSRMWTSNMWNAQKSSNTYTLPLLCNTIIPLKIKKAQHQNLRHLYHEKAHAYKFCTVQILTNLHFCKVIDTN